MTNRIMLGAAFLFLSLATGFAQGVGDNEEAQARMQKGVSLYQQGQYAAALAEMEPVAAGFPNYAAAYRLVGLCQLQLKRYEKAAETLRRANQLSQEQEKRDDPAARIGLGRALLYAEKWAEALPELEYAVSQNKSDAAAHYSLAVARYKLGDEAGATSSLTQATTLNERNADAWRLLAELHLNRVTENPQDKSAVARALASAQKVKTLDAAAGAGALGRLYVAAQQFPKAIPELERAVAARPTDGALHFNLGLALSRTEQLARAATVLEKTAELLPDNADVLRELGYVYERADKPAQALAVYEKADALTGGRDEYFKRAIERLRPRAKS
jgi:tetratricopeptide (TPR) repeat protein